MAMLMFNGIDYDDEIHLQPLRFPCLVIRMMMIRDKVNLVIFLIILLELKMMILCQMLNHIWRCAAHDEKVQNEQPFVGMHLHL